ncbi:MAG: prepilin-type N-terminal cleavage/methylation domain-containing protein [Planctomycetota bacterium]|nr:prepilin-type N-terminal cleavage/methylation domain-containing protein [Planctomycetota bacterium]
MQRKAFTLVELLVVVAVIAILISLLLPAINRFRVQAQSTECLTNQRNLIAAYTQYSIDKNGRVPGTDTGAYAYDWMQTVGGQHNPGDGCCNGFQNGVVNWDQGGDDASNDSFHRSLDYLC